MIYTNDIRRGNLVNYLEVKHTDIRVIKSIHETFVFFLDSNWSVERHKIEPIPLTNQWLFAAGFGIHVDEHGFKTAYSKNLNPITQEAMITLQETGEGWFFDNALFKVPYVHTLQNLIHSLTGIEMVFNTGEEELDKLAG